MKRQIIALLIITMLFCFAGCMTSATSGVLVEKGHVFIENPAFAANIEVVSDARTRTEDGFLHAQVTLKNKNRCDFECQCRFEWRGENGMIQKHALTPWRPMVMLGRETVDVDAVSPLQDTADFRLMIRRVD